MEKIGIALIGCGYWGNNYFETLKKMSSVAIKYVCDMKKPFELQEKFTDNYKEAIEDEEVNSIVIATPTKTHYEIAKYALEHGKNVLVEKPMTSSSKEAEDLIKIAEENNKILMVGHTFMYNPAVNALKSCIEKGELGKILSINARRLNLGPIRKEENVMWDLAPHDISMFLYLANSSPHKVSASGAKFIGNHEDIITLNLKMKNNVFSTATVSWIYPLKIRDLVIVGDKKMAIFDDTNVNKLAIHDLGVEKIEDAYKNFHDYAITYREGDIILPKISGKKPLDIQCNHFIECIRDNKKPLSDGKNGLEVVRVLECAQKSLNNNGAEVLVE